MMQAGFTSSVRQRNALANETLQLQTTPQTFPETSLGGFGEQMPLTSSVSDEPAAVEDQCVLKDDPKTYTRNP